MALLVPTLLIFACALVLILWRPRGWHEAWWAVGGAAAVLLLGAVSLAQAREAVLRGRDPLLFLVALLLLSAAVEQSGFFEWAAMHCARLARGDAHALYRNIFWLGAAITITLSLDTTAVILTPLVIALARQLQLPGRPYILTCAFVANAASLLLPMSNLTNLLLANAFGFSFAGFALRMLAPQAVTLLLSYGLLRASLRDELPATFEPGRSVPPRSLIRHAGYFRSTCLVLTAVFVGYFVGPLFGVQPYTLAFLGAAALALCFLLQVRRRPSWVAEVSWGVVPFVIGLFVLVRAVENMGLVEPLARATLWLGEKPAWLAAPAMGFSSAVLSNVINNLPATLLSRTVLQAAHAAHPLVLAVLLGANIGPNMTVLGSLATILVLGVARGKGERLSGSDLLRVGLAVTPAVLLAAALALAAELPWLP